VGDDVICPRCNEALSAVEDQGVPFMGCTKCYGLFVAEPDLFVYVEKAASPRVFAPRVFAAFVELHERMVNGTRSAGTLRHCPQCRARLERVTFGENPLVLLDRCGEHGIWLDRTELNKVLRAARAAAGQRHDDLVDGKDDEVGPLKGAPGDPSSP
jgi:Zn-finger nucleic acid-binding protein